MVKNSKFSVLLQEHFPIFHQVSLPIWASSYINYENFAAARRMNLQWNQLRYDGINPLTKTDILEWAIISHPDSFNEIGYTIKLSHFDIKTKTVDTPVKAIEFLMTSKHQKYFILNQFNMQLSYYPKMMYILFWLVPIISASQHNGKIVSFIWQHVQVKNEQSNEAIFSLYVQKLYKTPALSHCVVLKRDCFTFNLF